MIDVAVLRNQPDLIADSLRRRGMSIDLEALGGLLLELGGAFLHQDLQVLLQVPELRDQEGHKKINRTAPPPRSFVPSRRNWGRRSPPARERNARRRWTAPPSWPRHTRPPYPTRTPSEFSARPLSISSYSDRSSRQSRWR